MSAPERHPTTDQVLRRDGEVVANSFNAALQIVAIEVGGQDLLTEVNLLAFPDGQDNMWPEAVALELLEARQPGAVSRVADRFNKIQEERHEQERKAVDNLFSQPERRSFWQRITRRGLRNSVAEPQL